MTDVDPKITIYHGEDEKRWTFITNHAAVLLLLAKDPRITAREISQEVGITERSVRTDNQRSGQRRLHQQNT